MAICVTGGAGYIGSHVVRQLSERGEEVIVIDNLSSGYADALIHGEKLLQGDIRDSQFLSEVFKNDIEAVIHFAASISVPESVAKPLDYYSNNVFGTLNLLTECVKTGIKNFLFSSTAAVYGMPSSGIALEDADLRPINPYGSSKLMCEKIIMDQAVSGVLKYGILRYFNVAGADPKSRMGQRKPDATHLIKVCAQAAVGQRDHVNIFGTDYDTSDGTCVRDYIHVEDLAAAHILAVDHIRRGGKSLVLNAGYGHGYTVNEVVETVRRLSGMNFRTVNAPRRAGDPPSLVANSDRIRAQLKWNPRFDNLDAIVQDSLNWERKMNTYK